MENATEDQSDHKSTSTSQDQAVSTNYLSQLGDEFPNSRLLGEKWILEHGY